MNTIPARDRLIVALDTPNASDALALVDSLEGVVSFYKVGLELFVSEGKSVVHSLLKKGHRVFLDLKMNDVDETVRRAVAQVARLNVSFLTIYGTSATVRAAVEGRGDSPGPRILAVTLLTSMGKSDLEELGILGGRDARFADVEEFVDWRAQDAVANGCDGLIASGQNVARLSRLFMEAPKKPVFICPGIRPAGEGVQEHKRPSTPYDAIVNGADYLVVGRPIRDAKDRAAQAAQIIAEIEKGLAERK